MRTWKSDFLYDFNVLLNNIFIYIFDNIKIEQHINIKKT